MSFCTDRKTKRQKDFLTDWLTDRLTTWLNELTTNQASDRSESTSMCTVFKAFVREEEESKALVRNRHCSRRASTCWSGRQSPTCEGASTPCPPSSGRTGYQGGAWHMSEILHQAATLCCQQLQKKELRTLTRGNAGQTFDWEASAWTKNPRLG